jgi:hypothetical protein
LRQGSPDARAFPWAGSATLPVYPKTVKWRFSVFVQNPGQESFNYNLLIDLKLLQAKNAWIGMPDTGYGRYPEEPFRQMTAGSST